MTSVQDQAKALLEFRDRKQIVVDQAYVINQSRQIKLKEFFQEAWHVIEPATPFKPNWHLDAISDHLEALTYGEIQNLIINIPPRHTKSICVSVVWMVWSWTIDPSLRWLFSSYSEKLSIRDSIKCRRLIRSEWFQTYWGKLFNLTEDQNQKVRFENDQTGMRLATSVGGIGTGEGGQVLVVDDPHKVDEIESDVIRQGVLDWWDKTMSTRLNDPNTGSKVVVMQRIHEDDLTGHLISKMQDDAGADKYELLILPAEYDGNKRETSIGFSDPRTEYGELLNPERFDKTRIAALRASLGAYSASGQLQQSPAPPGGGIFKKQWWRFWYPNHYAPPERFITRVGKEYFEHDQIAIPVIDTYAQSWDMAFKDNVTSSEVVGQVWGRTGGNFFLLDSVSEKMDIIDTLDAVRAMTERWPETGEKLIEDKANGPAVIQTLKGKIPGLIPIQPLGDKEARARAITPFIESGNVYLPHPKYAPWVKDTLTQFAKFPRAILDDQVDALSQMLARWTRGLSPSAGRRNYMRTQDFKRTARQRAIRRYQMDGFGSKPSYGNISENGRGDLYRRKSGSNQIR